MQGSMIAGTSIKFWLFPWSANRFRHRRNVPRFKDRFLQNLVAFSPLALCCSTAVRQKSSPRRIIGASSEDEDALSSGRTQDAVVLTFTIDR
jgi:hypothetical protein